jgi:uncharacterized membrane protein YdbT with pleckstrin-like domain
MNAEVTPAHTLQIGTQGNVSRQLAVVQRDLAPREQQEQGQQQEQQEQQEEEQQQEEEEEEEEEEREDNTTTIAGGTAKRYAPHCIPTTRISFGSS